MKKLLVILVLIVGTAISHATFAQVQFSLGIKGGVNFASINVQDAQATWDNKTGFHGGAFALFKLTAFAVQPEVVFSQQGSTVTYNSQDIKANFNYVNVPIIAKFYLPGGFNFQLGPQFGFLTGVESDYDPISGVPSGDDLEDYYKNSDISLGMGIGWDLPFKFTIDARYNLGLTDIDDNGSLEATRNQVFQLSVGYKLIKFGK